MYRKYRIRFDNGSCSVLSDMDTVYVDKRLKYKPKYLTCYAATAILVKNLKVGNIVYVIKE